MHAQPGHFYAIGIGPGAPDLLTVRAVMIIESADIILTPQANGSNRSLALKAIEPYLQNQEVMTVNYPMQRNEANTNERWKAVASDVVEKLRQNKSVAMITIGDPLIFATTSYLLYSLTESLMEENIHIIPGISAFQIGASKFHDPLTLQEDRLTLMSATDLAAVENALDHCETLVLYKAAGVIEELLPLLKVRGLLESSKLISSAEQGEGELLLNNLSTWQPRELSYMTTMIVRIGNRSWLNK
ncbi:precorrin-2 C(20)-methyltransferase [Malonomonas rubra]|uniref:precorrin-2 C(20)-methyltransferase n=1 Tax=Malonomonas rubra TaxID=57040 RepID=UPI0026ED37C5|nr:precorrin-2 C(20)-methyltransferase [Malonomonas rubra]